MKKLLLLSTAALLAAGVSGCTDPCEDLEEVCQLCGDDTYYQSCTQLVQDGNQALCDLNKPTFTQTCVGRDDGSTSSGAGGSTSSGTGGAGTGGA